METEVSAGLASTLHYSARTLIVKLGRVKRVRVVETEASDGLATTPHFGTRPTETKPQS